MFDRDIVCGRRTGPWKKSGLLADRAQDNVHSQSGIEPDTNRFKENAMKALAISMRALAMIGGAATAYAGNTATDCHSISDSVYGVWSCR